MTKDFIVITGGSSGLGYEIALRFAAAGYPLVIAALPDHAMANAKAKLTQHFPELEIRFFPIDLTLPDGPDRLFDFTQEEGIPIGGLINNAGFGTWGFLPDVPVRRELEMMQLNILALYRLTRLFLPGMIARRQGQIMHISSIAAFQPNPYMATYGATKSFVRSFSQALERELSDKGIPVYITTVCPPAARTPFRQASGMDDSALFTGWLAVDAPLIADAAFKGYQRKQGLVIPGKLFRILHVLTRLLPEWVSTLIAVHTLRKGLPESKY